MLAAAMQVPLLQLCPFQEHLPQCWINRATPMHSKAHAFEPFAYMKWPLSVSHPTINHVLARLLAFFKAVFLAILSCQALLACLSACLLACRQLGCLLLAGLSVLGRGPQHWCCWEAWWRRLRALWRLTI